MWLFEEAAEIPNSIWNLRIRMMKYEQEGEERKGDWFQTFTGKQFYILDPRPEDFCVEDVAHSLSGMARYNAHCRRPNGHIYTVGQHCLIMMRYVITNRVYGTYTHDDDGLIFSAYDALMHEVGEPYTGDRLRPVKLSLPHHEKDWTLVEAMAADVFGVPEHSAPWLKELDNRIVINEKNAFMRKENSHLWWHTQQGLKPLEGVSMIVMSPDQVKQEFLHAYHSLMQGRLP